MHNEKEIMDNEYRIELNQLKTDMNLLRKQLLCIVIEKALSEIIV